MCDRDCGGTNDKRGTSGSNARPLVNSANATPRKASGQSLLAGSAAFAAMGIAGVVHGQIVMHVDQSNPSASGNGNSWGSSFRDLQTAFDVLGNATPDQLRGLYITIKVAQGTYRPNETRPIAFRIGTQSTASAFSISIQGGFAGRRSAFPDARDFISTRTILSADTLGNDSADLATREDNCDVVLAVQGDIDPRLTSRRFFLDGVTIQDGYNRFSGHPGGGIRLWKNESGSSSFALTDCTIRNNFSFYGGAGLGTVSGWDQANADLTITRCEFSNNVAQGQGGGAAFSFSDYVTMIDSTFVNNSAAAGGALVLPGYANIGSVKFTGNHAWSQGGALYSESPEQGPPIELWNCLLVGNSSEGQGGAARLSGNVRLSHCTVAHNSAQFGGGVFVASSGVSLAWSIIGENWASAQGAALAGGGNFPQLNGVCVEDGANGCYFPFALNSIYPYRTHVEFKDPDGPDGSATTWQDNDYHLSPRSGLVDSGRLITAWTEVDLDNNLRPVQGIVGRGLRADLGCYESQLTLCPTDIDADQGVTIDDLLDFLAAFELGQPLADLTTNGSTPFPDGGVTVDDLLFFLAKFEQGC